MLTVAAVADRLAVSPGTVRGLIARGELASHHFGRCVRVSEADLEAYVGRSRSEGAPGRVAPALKWVALPERGGWG